LLVDFLAYSSTLKTVAAHSSETLVNLCNITPCHVPYDSAICGHKSKMQHCKLFLVPFSFSLLALFLLLPLNILLFLNSFPFWNKISFFYYFIFSHFVVLFLCSGARLYFLYFLRFAVAVVRSLDAMNYGLHVPAVLIVTEILTQWAERPKGNAESLG
jgi:hypothetical protein